MKTLARAISTLAYAILFLFVGCKPEHYVPPEAQQPDSDRNSVAVGCYFKGEVTMLISPERFAFVTGVGMSLREHHFLNQSGRFVIAGDMIAVRCHQVFAYEGAQADTIVDNITILSPSPARRDTLFKHR